MFNPSTQLSRSRKAVDIDKNRYGKYNGIGGEVDFRSYVMEDEEEEEEESGVCSPPLWTNDSSHRYLNPTLSSRAEAIARGQLELMEMVKNMEETSYELSLKDLVENQRNVRADDEETSKVEERAILEHQHINWKRNSEKRRKNVDQNRGFLLNVFPFNFGLYCKNNSNDSIGTGWAKVSPKTEALDKSRGSESDFWRRKFSILGTISSRGGSTSSSSGSTRRSGSSSSSSSSGATSSRSSSVRKYRGCMPDLTSLFNLNKSKAAI